MRQTTETASPFSNEARNAYVTEHLTDALVALLRKKPLEEISVSELCTRAGVGRASFYRNYESKEEILTREIDRLFRAWTDGAGQNENIPLSEWLGRMFAHFERHRAFYELLNRRGLTGLLKDAVVGLCGPKPEHAKEEAYARAYVAYALYGWIEVWFQRGMCETAEEIAEMFRLQKI